MTMFVKICGMTDERAIETAVDCGVDAVGFVFSRSPRQLTTAQASKLSEGVPGNVLRVAVFRRPQPDEIERVLDEFSPDLVQADHDTIAGIEMVETLPVFREGLGIIPNRPRFLYEGPQSGVGHQVAIDDAARMARLGEMVLAGGLRPENVGTAILAVRPFGVDVSSGVETGPGEKDPALIRSFVAAVRSAEERLVRA